MPKGGARIGAGRPKLSVNVKKISEISPTVAETPQELPSCLRQTYTDPLDFLMAVMNDPAMPVLARQDAAKSLMPFKHARKGEGGKKDEKDSKAKAAAGKFNVAMPPSLRAVQ